jgi:hypothetical protein
MKKKSKLSKVDNGIVYLRDGSKWKIGGLDEVKVKRWSTIDEIESESIGIDRGLLNLPRKEKVKADPYHG